jgi:hypothetical protein
MDKEETLKYSLFSTMLLAVGLATPAGAADNCSDILAHGAFEIRSESSKEQQGSAFLTWACSSQSSKKSAAGDAGGDVGFQLPNLPPIQAKGHAINSTSEEYRNEACSFSNGTFNHAEEFSQFASTVSRDLVQAWEACMNRYGTFTFAIMLMARRRLATMAYPPTHL